MSQNESINALSKLAQILEPFSSIERQRLIRAVTVLLGDSDALPEAIKVEVELDELPPRVLSWMKSNSIEKGDLDEAYHRTGGEVQIIVGQMPGRNRKDQTLNCYILMGLSRFLLTGDASFDDKSARSLCESSGCYDSANHAAYLKAKGNELAGSKERGWVLTGPGLKRAAEILKDINKLNR